MPGAIIAIDQDRPGPTVSTGTAGVARKDLWVGQVVNPRNTTTGNTNPQWTLLDKPFGSAATLSGATTNTCSFTPDLPGSYRLQLVVNGGGPGNSHIIIAACTYDVAGVLVERGWRLPALYEGPNENNFGGQTRGWDEAWQVIKTDLLAVLTAVLSDVDGLTSTTDGLVIDVGTLETLVDALLADPFVFTQNTIRWFGGSGASGGLRPKTDTVRDCVQTTNNTETTLGTPYTVPAGKIVRITSEVLADRTDVDGDAAWFVVRAVYKEVASALVEVSAPEVLSGPGDIAGAAAWTCVIDDSGVTARTRVKGENGKTIKWSLVSECIEEL